MRMEELKNESYIKSADTVERYLLDIVRQYFVDHVEVPETSRESFIQDALDVMKQEVDFDTLGVLSITLPNGETRIGNVNLSLEDLGGEPKISPKRGAFNVDFGSDAGTACEGNDPRLSDARTPLPHTHSISDIPGLTGKISTINNLINTINEYSHAHHNKEVLDKIIYNGTKSSIDITIIETLSDEINEVINSVNNTVQTFTGDLESRMTQVESQIREINRKTDELLNAFVADNLDNLDTIRREVDEKLADAVSQVTGQANLTYLKKQEFNTFVNKIRDAYYYAGTETIALNTIIKSNITFGQKITINISNTIKNKVQEFGSTMQEAKYDAYIIKSNEKYPVPIVLYKSSSSDVEPIGTMSIITNKNNGNISLLFNCRYSDYSSSGFNGTLVIDVYSKRA